MQLTSQVRGERPSRTMIVGGMLVPSRLHALSVLPGPVSALLLALVLLFCAVPVIATAQRSQEIPQKPTWRVIRDAPYRVVPAYSPLKKTGETLKELGFESVDALLSGIEKRSFALSVAFSPNGLLLATGGWDGAVKLWDVQARTLLATLEGHANFVLSVAFSPDGRLLATGSEDRTVKLWDVQARTLLATLEGHANFVLSVAFSPDGRLLATGSGDRMVKLWEVQTRTLLATLEGHANSAMSVAFSPDGRLLATGSGDGTVKLWEVQTRTLLATLEGHADMVLSVAFSPEGRLLATGSGDGTVKLWEVQTRTLLTTLEGHANLAMSVAFSPEGRLLATGSGDGMVKLWEVQTRTLLATLEGHTSGVSSVAFSPNGVSSVAFSPNGGLLATGLWNRPVELWEVQTHTLLAILESHANRVQSVAFSPNGGLLATGSGDGAVRLWEVQVRTLLATLEGHASVIRVRVGVSRDGRLQAMDVHAVFNGGAYGAFRPNVNFGARAASSYNIPVIRVVAERVYTNQVPGGTHGRRVRRSSPLPWSRCWTWWGGRWALTRSPSAAITCCAMGR